ncbi:MAG: OmpA family protein [Alphaproteobacteria bacterium]|nr:OmpA family protein [Alphaproteobacteria bacterium]
MITKRLFFIVYIFILALSSCQNNATHNNGSSASDSAPGTQEELDKNVGNFVLFKVSSASLDRESIQNLDRQADWLKRYRYINIIVEGHCDERGTREFNLALGARRANTVKDYLVSSGIDSSRITTISYGKERPVILGTGSEVWRQNRRSVVVLN